MYFGCLYNGEPHGIGIKFLQNKMIESGNFKKGMLDGFGKKILSKGHVFIGKFFEGKMDEKGYFFDKTVSKWFIFNKSKHKMKATKWKSQSSAQKYTLKS